MPNWVCSNLIITDPTGEHPERIERLAVQVGATYTHTMFVWCEETKVMRLMDVANSEAFSLWNIVCPEGKELARYEASLGQPGSPFWYDWNIRNWGTKWDASDVAVEDISLTERTYRFETAWWPPISALVTLSAQYPELHFELDWEEEQGFGGTFVLVNGEAEETNSYDIPNSHAEYKDRDWNCLCEDWGPEEAFLDCPSYAGMPIAGSRPGPEDEISVRKDGEQS